jgi:hypothetical protein
VGRLLASDGGVKGVDITTERGVRSYNPDKKGVITVDNPTHAKRLKAEGFFEASLMGPTVGGESLGYTCIECGFGSWFALCSRCGHNNSTTPRDGE